MVINEEDVKLKMLFIDPSEKSNGEMNMFGLNYTKDEQISIWVINRTKETWGK